MFLNKKSLQNSHLKLFSERLPLSLTFRKFHKVVGGMANVPEAHQVSSFLIIIILIQDMFILH